MTITPFKDAVKPPAGDKGIINVKSLYRRLKAIFGNFQISGSGGIELSDTALGIHIKVKDPNNGLLWAWQPQAGGGGVAITPGFILLRYPFSDSAPPSTQQFIPVINGVALDAATPPVLPIFASGETFVMLEAKVSKNGDPQDLPWAIKAFNAQPSNVALIRPHGSVSGQDGILYCPLAKFFNGVQTAQAYLGRPINAYWTYNLVQFT